ncbi:four helix bundle protein [Segetibacter sp. 3557_3]|uniref:four helix bundle protein n=1 Tax=Segetibacter sp. 3557_3 TaxID=2547429 RepID=UPI0010585D21|nr:four helix bundle protein [Segetibacter sp. 3557_3]TDH27449.1 four helix bundle protein [Segetibacter sp. 3557_3]
MPEKSILKDKSFNFAIRVINLYKYLTEVKKEFVMSKQLLRSGTAIGALIREAQNGESKMDFVHKLAIAQKECDESLYWLELLHQTQFLSESEFQSIHSEAENILRMIKSSIITVKQNLKK